jgi:hypothetical protein
VTDRNHRLKQIHHCLNTPEGKVLMDELRILYDQAQLFDPDALIMAGNVAGRDFYKVMESYQRGDNIK